jgi:hypothetical protein
MRTINLHRRLEALEKQFTSEPILLKMPDGRIETLPGYNEYVLDLVARAGRGDRTPEMELIAQSIGSAEPGGGHMIDLVRAFLNGQIEAVRPDATRV